MKKKIIGLLMAGLLISALTVPAMAAGTAEVSGFYDIKVPTSSDITVTALSSQGTIEAKTVTIAGKAVTVQNNSDQLKVTVNGAASDGMYLALLTDNGSEVPTSSSTIYYIDQLTGASKVEFTVFPNLDEIQVPTTLKLFVTKGGSDSSSALSTATVSYAPKTTYPVPDYVLGDVNNDGDIDSQDALEVLKYFAGLTDLSETQKLSANVHGKNTPDIDSQDALDILKHFAGLIDSFE